MVVLAGGECRHAAGKSREPGPTGICLAGVTVDPRCRGARKAGCAGRTQWGRHENHASHAWGPSPKDLSQLK